MPTTETTLYVHYLFSSFALLVIGTRLALRKFQRAPLTATGAAAAASRQAARFELGDYLGMAAALLVMARIALEHIVLVWGTNNLSPAYRQAHHFSPQELYQREVGSRLNLANRAVYNCYLWTQKFVLMDLYRRMLRNERREKYVVWSFMVILGATFVAAEVVGFTDCVPIDLYWQVVPDPGPCVQAQAQLFAVGAMNVATELMLFVLPLPIVLSLRVASWGRKARLVGVFMLGIILIGMSIARLAVSAFHEDSENHRSIWTHAELQTAAVVVNAPTIYGLWNKRRAWKREARLEEEAEARLADVSASELRMCGDTERNETLKSVSFVRDQEPVRNRDTLGGSR